MLLMLASLRLRSQQAIVIHLTVYLSFGVLSNLFELLLSLAGEPSSPILPLLSNFFLVGMVATFGALTLNFLEREKNHILTFWASSSLILVVWLVTASRGISLNFIPGLSNIVVLTGLMWLITLATGIITLTTEFKQKQSAKHLNRLRYWLTATVLFSISGLFSFANPLLFDWLGWPLILTASILISYVVLTYHTRDLSLFVGRIFYHITVGGAIAAIFYLSLAATIVMSRSTTDTVIILVWTIILALFLATATPFVRQFLNRIFTRIIFGKQYRDEKEVIKYYSQSVSGALDIQRLADTLIQLMIETLDIRKGAVFVNKRGARDKISLNLVASVGFDGITNGEFSIDSPFIDHFRNQGKPIHQYDVDVLPDFKVIRPEEKEWLTDTGMDLYVPIMRNQELVGVLSFGPKRKGISYSSEEIYLMRALADQAALAMDSARLFFFFSTTNQEIGSFSEQLVGLGDNIA
ncbi:MAG: GAF domain-containing protein, partial [Anaerolineae bacterium]|nr:GAF domain-containing protein [Anaerolineae bacterium]